VNFEYLADEKMGIVVFNNTISKEDNIVNKLESSLSNSNDPFFSWKEALVGEGQKMPDYRDCVDFKINKKYVPNFPPQYSSLSEAVDLVESRLNSHLRMYQQKYNINMTYMEAINFVKYGPKQHFAVHADHGFSYICTVSSILYLNDDYEGGELWFPYLDIKWKPKMGDMVFFPSTYIYAHASMPVTSGTKYSAVTMFDYNDDAHQYGGFSRNFETKQVATFY